MLMDRESLRQQVDAAVASIYGKEGVGFSAALIVREFAGRGAGESTLYRWIKDAIARGVWVQAPTPTLEGNLTQHRQVAEAGTIEVIARLKTCVEVADQVIRHARTADGLVKNARLLLMSSEHLRRCLETAARLQEVMADVSRVERFHRAIFDVLRSESPAFAQRVLDRLREVNAQFAGLE